MLACADEAAIDVRVFELPVPDPAFEEVEPPQPAMPTTSDRLRKTTSERTWFKQRERLTLMRTPQCSENFVDRPERAICSSGFLHVSRKSKGVLPPKSGNQQLGGDHQQEPKANM